jgi:hypothetical protein
MPQREYSKEREQVTKVNQRVQEYNKAAECEESFHKIVDEMIELYPELFPAGIAQGYWLHDRQPVSKELPDGRVRRITRCRSLLPTQCY